MTFTTEEAKKIGGQIGIDWDKAEFDPETLAAGMEVELEHGSKKGDEFNVTDDDPETTATIAWVHLSESPRYYTALASMEKQLKEKKASYRQAYQQVRKGPWKKPKMSPELEAEVKKYLQQVIDAIKGGMSADDAFNKVQPDLDNHDANGILNLVGENQFVGKRPLAKLKDVLSYGDVFTGVQVALEMTIWEAAVLWWGEQATEKADKDIALDQPKIDPDEQGTQAIGPKSKKTNRDDTKTVELSKGASVLTFAGFRYVG